MPITFPRSHGQFLDLLPVLEATRPRLTEQVTQSRARAGQIERTDIGDRLWYGRITVQPDEQGQTDQLYSQVHLLTEAAGSFLWYRKARLGPQGDPTGSILGAATPTLGAVSGDLRDLTINGLPANYILRAGDMLSFQYGSGPVRYALHEVVVQRQATVGGQITLLSVAPLVAPGWGAGSAITLVRPTCKAIIVPESLDPSKDFNRMATSFTFDWLETRK